jgi:cytochrome c biogenesis protein
VRDRRLWVWLQAEGDGNTRISTALSSTRRTLDGDTEFEKLKAQLLKETPA